MSGIGLGIWLGKWPGASSYWTQQKINDSCLFFASHPTDLLSKVSATHLPNQVTGSSDFLTVTGSGLNARYRTPDNATYRTADSDYVFWKSDASESTCDGNRLIAYDFPRILVKYLNVSPYTILWIAILKPGVTVTNGMKDTFDLSIWWDNTLSFHGDSKQNRSDAQSVWTPESVAPAIPTGLTLSLISNGVKIDWADNTGGVAQTEIWAQNDGGASALAYTINAGIVTKSETGIEPVDLRYIKIRSKNGSLYSNFTAEQSIAMLYATEYIGAGWCANPPSGYWSTVADANWSADGTKLTSTPTVNSGTLQINFFYDGSGGGKSYKTKMTIVRRAGAITGGYYDGGASLHSTTGTYYYITFAQNGNTDRNIYMQSGAYANRFDGDITAISVKRIIMP
jgi:hypothetical protein